MSFPVIPDLTPSLDFDREEISDFLLLSIAYKNIGLSSLYNGFGHVLEKAGKEESAELVQLVSQAFAAATALEQSVDDQLIAILEKSQSNEE